MRIFTLWRREGGDEELPWLVDALDEYSVEENGLTPEYENDQQQPDTRQLILEIPDAEVTKLFNPSVKVVKAKIVEEPCPTSSTSTPSSTPR